MEPLISIRILNQQHPFHPGDQLRCEYQVDAVEARDIQAIEASVLWHTEGKGDEDMAVHHFERRLPNEVENRDLRTLRVLETQLPNSPLTYSGVIVKIRWCVRVRVFLRRGKETFFEQTFELGSVPAARALREEVEPASSEDEPEGESPD